ncbi:MAG TPA: hypothetical protein VLQ92_07055 [Candidatus Limnocylindrales bacterium]|nr:hypothetical protein [Candidatus Limnocylindrales bacterium]
MTAISTRVVRGRTYRRDPVRTHKVGIGEDLGGVIALYAAERITPATTLCLSQKFVAICNGDVRHISEVTDSWLARLIVKYVTKKDNGDIGYSHPKKMQVAIDEVGYPRMMAAVVGGGIGKFVLRRNGDFYRIAGHHISEIDGFNPDAMPPFDQYAMLPPKHPDAICEELAQRFGCAAYIIDGNNINVEVVGRSTNLPMSDADAREVMLDNPMGQGDELTPVFLITPEA